MCSFPRPRKSLRWAPTGLLHVWTAAALLLACQAIVAAPLPAPSEPAMPTQTPAHLLALMRSKIMLNPVPIRGDPYTNWQGRQPPHDPAGTVCGVHFEADAVHYRVSTFANPVAAHAAQFAVTHSGACGTCSSMKDLAVYLERPDLTTPVRNCAMTWDTDASLRCLQDLGFSAPCARTWLYDALNTRRHCLAVCLWSLLKDEASTDPDGRLNACLQCDEDRSGPVFKATAGRTRRNSGIRSSIPRSSDEIATITHDYVPDAGPR